MTSFEAPSFVPSPKLTELENKALSRDASETVYPSIEMEVPEGHAPIPEAFVQESTNFLEGEYMSLITPRERYEMLSRYFNEKMANWLEDPESNANMEKALRQSDLMKEGARWLSRCFVEAGFITEEQRTSKLELIGVSEPA